MRVCAELPDSLANCIAFLLNLAAQEIRDATEESLRPLRLPPKHYSLIATISTMGPMTQQSLGALLRVDRTTMVMMVDDLEKKGAVVRGPNPGDRRCHAVALSGAGRDLFKRAIKRVAEAEDEFLEPLSAKEKGDLKRILNRLIRKHHKALSGD